jgi:hypothetical protein
MTTMTHDRLLDLLKQAKGALDTLATLATADLSDDEFEIVVTTFAEFRNSVQSAANYLAVLRKQHSA